MFFSKKEEKVNVEAPSSYHETQPVNEQQHEKQPRHSLGAASQPSESASVAADLQANCPVCRSGIVKRRFTKCGIIFCIILFPVGTICCYLLSSKQCNKCGYKEGL